MMCGVPDLKIASAMMSACMLLAVESVASAEEQRVHAQVGSFWNYQVTDEIKQAKSVLETTLTEANGDERVIRANVRGQPSGFTWVFDKNWGAHTFGAFKFVPNNGLGVPQPLETGSKSKTKPTYSQQSAIGWSDPKPMDAGAEIVSTETTSTTAGQFETSRGIAYDDTWSTKSAALGP